MYYNRIFAAKVLLFFDIRKYPRIFLHFQLEHRPFKNLV